jgi:hypothetical protein
MSEMYIVSRQYIMFVIVKLLRLDGHNYIYVGKSYVSRHPTDVLI